MNKKIAANLERELLGHAGPINAVRYTSDGNYCMTGSDDRTLRLWNPNRDDSEAQSRALTIKTYSGVHGHPILDLVIANDNGKFASVGGDRTSFVWDVSTGRVIRRFQGHSHRINTVKMNEDCTVLITGSYDQTIRLWDMRSNDRDPIQILDDFQDSVTSISRTRHEIIGGSVDGCIRIYDLRMGRMYVDDLKSPITCIAMTYDKKCVLAGCLGGTVRLSELSTGRLLQYYQGHVHTSFKLEAVVANDDAHILAGSEDGTVHIWDLVAAGIGTKFQAHNKSVSSLTYHPTQPVLVTGSFDGTGRCWSIKT